MVAAVRSGRSLYEVARRFGAGWNTVDRWLARAGSWPLDEVMWEDQPKAPHRTGRTEREVEDLVLTVRSDLKRSDLGEYGARAIYEDLVRRMAASIPKVRTIGEILKRRGALDGRQRIRRSPPPRGWYLPDLAKRVVEADSFDFIEGLVIQSGPHVEVLTGLSVHGGLPACWAMDEREAKATTVVEALLEHWRAFGLPAYAQFDNDTRFHGTHRHPDSLGRVVRCCLQLGVVPVFVPPRETGFQAAIENFNGRWQTKVWARFHHRSLSELRRRSDRYRAAYRVRAAVRVESAPPRTRFPKGWKLDLQLSPRGRVIFLRRTSERGSVFLLGRHFDVAPHWIHRLVRAELDLDAQHIRFFALRRRDPTAQPCLGELPYRFPSRRFWE